MLKLNVIDNEDEMKDKDIKLAKDIES